MNGFNRFITRATFNANDRIELYDNFRQYLLDGVEVDTAYLRLIDSYTRRGKKPKHAIAEILRECYSHLATGSTLSESLSEWIPDSERSVIEASDAKNATAEGFYRAEKMAKDLKRMKSAMFGAVSMLMFMFLCFFALLAMICSMLIPYLLQVTPLYMWSSAQKLIYYFYVFISDFWYIAVVALGTLIYFIIYSLPRWTGNSRYHADKFVPYSLYRTLNGATFVSNVDAMLSSGISLRDALLKIKSSSRSKWLIERIDGALIGLAHGEGNLGAALDVSGYDFPSEDAIIKLRSIFDTSNKNGSLTSFSDRWQESTITSLEKMSKSIQVLGMLGCAFGIIAVCVILSPLVTAMFNF
ncbi:type II secretion system F family protein [Salmonella enterica]|nr:pilus assembly protein PilR [Salmonella enterica]EEP3373121.1 pilus assembly protein PilR [Salmonella enterica]EFP6579681.1 pilus assembly protein PilR [Salmonella enterica]EGC7971448.1 pilus assembly protein PilR [Salmonella enterica]EIV4461673.1 type II secretion system F family protein [Salmonella enterica]